MILPILCWLVGTVIKWIQRRDVDNIDPDIDWGYAKIKTNWCTGASHGTMKCRLPIQLVRVWWMIGTRIRTMYNLTITRLYRCCEYTEYILYYIVYGNYIHFKSHDWLLFHAGQLIYEINNNKKDQNCLTSKPYV